MLRTTLAAAASAASLAAQTWTQLAPVVSPLPRLRHAMAYDQRRDRVVIFGGTGNFAAFLGDAWEYNGAAWSAIPVPAALGPRVDARMAYDHGRGKVVLYGGWRSPAFLADTWEYDGLWTHVVTAHNPGPRANPAMTWDAARGRVVLFSGQTTTPQSDTWEFDGVDWTQVVTPTAPAARSFSAMAYDASRGRCVLFGGATGVQMADTWEYDGVTWSQVPTMLGPPGRSHHAMVYDVVRGRIVLLGGMASLVQAHSDQWEYDGVTRSWALVTPQAAPGARRGLGLVFDLERRRVCLFGGEAGAPGFTLFGDTWAFTAAAVPTWTRHGRGCAGSAGVPTIDPPPGAQPALGANWLLQIGSLPASPGWWLLGFGFDVKQALGAPLPLDLAAHGMPGCNLWIDVAGISYLMPHGGGSTVFPLAFPTNPALAGTLVALQGLTLDAAAANGVGAVSNGGILLLR